MEYTITKEIESQIKVYGKIYAYDFIFLVIHGIMTFLFKSLVNEHLLILYYLFSAIMAIILTSPSTFNRQRRNYQSILIYLKRSDVLYRPVKNISREG